MGIYQQRSECIQSLHKLLMEEVDKECLSREKTYTAPFKKKLEGIILEHMVKTDMYRLYNQPNMPVSVKVLKSNKVEGSFSVYVLIGNGIFYEKIVHDGTTHKTISESKDTTHFESSPIPLPNKK